MSPCNASITADARTVYVCPNHLAGLLGLVYAALERFLEAEWTFVEARALGPRSTIVKECYQAYLKR